MSKIGEKNTSNILAFSAGGIIEDVTQKYTKEWDAVLQRRKMTKGFWKVFLG